MELDDDKWNFIKHGTGVLFKENQGQRTIDFHKVANGSSSFDAWSLSIYFGSLNQSERKALNKTNGSLDTTEDSFKRILADLEDSGVVSEKSQGVYILT